MHEKNPNPFAQSGCQCNILSPAGPVLHDMLFIFIYIFIDMIVAAPVKRTGEGPEPLSL